MTTPTPPSRTPSGKPVKTAPGSHPPLRRTPKGTTYAQGRPHQASSSGASGATPPASGRQLSSRRRSSPYRQVRRQYNAHVTTNYERVIVAEFVIAVLLVAVAPFTRKNKTGISPYYGQDMVQIVAIMAAYFILGLVAQAGGSTARISAWFGGLLLLGIGLGEAAYLAKEFSLFGASTSNTNSTSNPDAAAVGTNVTPPPPPVPEGT